MNDAFEATSAPPAVPSRPDAGEPAPTTAGGLLRRARLAQGMHIAALAAAIKVSQRKLEALEADRYAELPDPTFTRALAQTMCRALKIDPASVLALLPPPGGHRLEHVAEGLKTPFNERPGQLVPGEWAGSMSPVVWAALLVLVATGVIFFLPAGYLTLTQGLFGSAPAASAASAAVTVVETPIVVPPAPAASAGLETAEPAPMAMQAASDAAPGAAPSAATAVVPAAAAMLQFRARGDSWVEVIDAQGQSLLSRVVRAGETLDLDGAMPLRVRIGNAAVTDMSWRGQPVDLAPHTRENIARLELR
jgi:cytoskeleton protein RodZ